MERIHTTGDGFTLEVFSSMYLDWGLTISRNGEELFTGACCLSNESYGRKTNLDKYEDWDEAEVASMEGDGKAFVPWTEADWKECLEREADELIEAFLGHDIWNTIAQKEG